MATAAKDATQTHSATDSWTRAVMALRDADARFQPVLDTYNLAERAWFRLRAEAGPSKDKTEELTAAYAELGLDKAHENERRYGQELFEAAQACFETPVPHLGALIEKLELIETIGYDGSVEQLILADLRRLSELR